MFTLLLSFYPMIHAEVYFGFIFIKVKVFYSVSMYKYCESMFYMFHWAYIVLDMNRKLIYVILKPDKLHFS